MSTVPVGTPFVSGDVAVAAAPRKGVRWASPLEESLQLADEHAIGNLEFPHQDGGAFAADYGPGNEVGYYDEGDDEGEDDNALRADEEGLILEDPFRMAAIIEATLRRDRASHMIAVRQPDGRISFLLTVASHHSVSSSLPPGTTIAAEAASAIDSALGNAHFSSSVSRAPWLPPQTMGPPPGVAAAALPVSDSESDSDSDSDSELSELSESPEPAPAQEPASSPTASVRAESPVPAPAVPAPAVPAIITTTTTTTRETRSTRARTAAAASTTTNGTTPSSPRSCSSSSTATAVASGTAEAPAKREHHTSIIYKPNRHGQVRRVVAGKSPRGVKKTVAPSSTPETGVTSPALQAEAAARGGKRGGSRGGRGGRGRKRGKK